jgi:hypothetical protein
VQPLRSGQPGLVTRPKIRRILRTPAAAAVWHQPEEAVMSKGMNQKKDLKKKPAKTMKEKKAEKRDKKATKAFAPA